MDNIVELFFKKTFEKDLNEHLLYRSYELNLDEVMEYVSELLKLPFHYFITYLIENYNVAYLSSEDVLQYSSFENATTKLCAVLKENNDEGFRAPEIGKFLEDDGKARKETAFLKYGENHAKTGESIGLVYSLSNVFFCSCLGYVIGLLSDKEQRQLISRLILRNRLVQRLIYRGYTVGKASYMNEVDFLKDSTRKIRSLFSMSLHQ